MKLLYPILTALLLVASGTLLAQQGKPTEQEELALAAMEGLMAQSSERALPIIKKVLAGSQTTLVKQRALFVLSQIEGPEAEEILIQTSRSPDAALRDEAIRSIGIGGNDKSLAALQDIYRAGDAEVKEQVLHAWLIADRKEEVYQAALNAKSEEEAAEAIHMLGRDGRGRRAAQARRSAECLAQAGGRVRDQRRPREPAQDRRGQRRPVAACGGRAADRHHRR